MKKSIFLAHAAVIALCYSSPVFAQANGQAGGMNPAGNSTFGGGNSNDTRLSAYAMALIVMHQGRYADAIPFLEQALADRPHSADVLTNLGYAHFKIDDLAVAFSFYQKALAIDPDHKRAHEHLGEFYVVMQDATSADAQLAELTRLCPDGCDEKDALTKAIADSRGHP